MTQRAGRLGTVLRLRGRPLALCLGLAGCSAAGAGPVAGHPWFEDHSLALERQHLRVSVRERAVAVEASFGFRQRGAADGRVLTFVVPPPCEPVTEFSAALQTGEGAPVVLATRPSRAPSLPMGRVAAARDIALPAIRLAPHRELVVSYRQVCSTEFRYTLLTGAYWHGPIGELAVVVEDPLGRVQAATVEDQPPSASRGGEHRWYFRDIEPRSGVVLALRSPRGPDR